MHLQNIGENMGEEIKIQTVADVKTIDYMRNNNALIEQTITEQTNQVKNISDTLTDIQDTLDNQSQVDLSEVTELIENIDNTVVEVQTQDILTVVNNQQTEINDIKSNVDEINNKLDQILDKL